MEEEKRRRKEMRAKHNKNTAKIKKTRRKR